MLLVFSCQTGKENYTGTTGPSNPQPKMSPRVKVGKPKGTPGLKLASKKLKEIPGLLEARQN